MTKLPMKAGLLAAVAALSACSCLKSPDLDVAPVANGSKYGAGSYAGGAGAMPNNADVKSKFEQEFVAGGFDRRAVSVKKYLIGLGMEPAQLTTISYGKERPAVDGHDESAWAKNRRGVLVLQ